MSAVLYAVDGGLVEGSAGFDVAFVDDSVGGEVRRPLAEAVSVAFEAVAPVRRIPSYKGQRHNPGFYWSATTAAHVEFESWLERDEAMSLDFDSSVIGYAAQPFWLLWVSVGGKTRSHAPDFFARRSDGVGVVIDCRPASRVKPRDEEAFTATENACAAVGWEYRRVGGHEPVWLANLRWLAGYRHPRYSNRSVEQLLLTAFSESRELMNGAREVGDPIAVLPVLYHLLWTKQLVTDMAVRLDSGSEIVTGR